MPLVTRQDIINDRLEEGPIEEFNGLLYAEAIRRGNDALENVVHHLVRIANRRRVDSVAAERLIRDAILTVAQSKVSS